MMFFKAEVFQNPYLAEGAREVHAIMTVTAEGSPAPATPALRKVIGFICDTSGSMEAGKIQAAKDALLRTIDLLPEDIGFFVVAGAENGHVIAPTALATTENKSRAAAAVRQLRASGGTCMSTWLARALAEFETTPGAIKQALLLTDGENEKEDAANLDAVLDRCDGLFECECRGVGADWIVSELQKISGRLLGGTDIIPQPAMIATDFHRILASTLQKDVMDVNLRLWTPLGARVVFCKQVSPRIVDLAPRARQSSPQTLEFPTGAWGGSESRDYHFCVEVKPGSVGDEMLAGRTALVYTSNGVETKVAEARVLAIWTGDESKSTRIDRRVAHYTGQAELAQAIQEGLDARARGQNAEATRKLGVAVRIAHQSGNEDTAKLLRAVVDVDDAEKGTVRLKALVKKEDAMALETRSTRTSRLQPTA